MSKDNAEKQLEDAEKTLHRLLEWVARSDTRFSIVLGVDTGMLGALATFATPGPLSVLTFISAIVSVFLLALSLFFIYRGTYSRTKGPGGSLIYFGSISGTSRGDFKDRFRTRNTDEHLDDVLDQVHRNSEIVDRKFAALQRAYGCLLAAVAPWSIALYLFGVVPPPAA